MQTVLGVEGVVIVQGEETVHGAAQVLVQVFVSSGHNTVSLRESPFLRSKNLLLLFFLLPELTFSIAHLYVEYKPALVLTSSRNTMACGLGTIRTKKLLTPPSRALNVL